MCGIGLGFNLDRSRFESFEIIFTKTMSHRGPDAVRTLRRNNVWLGHARLSIVDLSENGNQPYVNATGNIHALVNGEIYNYRELREQYCADYDFVGDSDTEVVLALYELHGIDKCMNLLDGMYAVIIYDENINEVFMFRDIFGMKPLYYYCEGGCLIVGSEMKYLVEMARANQSPLSTDNSALYDFLTYGYVPTPKTNYKEIRKVHPYEFISFSVFEGLLQKTKYQDLADYVSSEETFVEISEVLECLRHSVSSHVNADVPVGILLSGGIDSNLLFNLGNNRIEKAFTLKFENSDRDETPYILSAYPDDERICIKNYMSGFENRKKALKSLQDSYGEPFFDTSHFALKSICSEVRNNGFKVVLAGDGGDELFWGYNHYSTALESFENKTNPLILKMYATLWRLSSLKYFRLLVRRTFERYFKEWENWTRAKGGMIKEEKSYYKNLLGIPADYDDYWYFKDNYVDALPPEKSLRLLDIQTYLRDDLLVKSDRASMSEGVEIRVPFVNKELFKVAFRLSSKQLDVKTGNKTFIRDSFKDFIPKGILLKTKSGFSIPNNSAITNGIFRQEDILMEYLKQE